MWVLVVVWLYEGSMSSGEMDVQWRAGDGSGGREGSGGMGMDAKEICGMSFLQ